ncbi:4'-phosphopantetheinyl transferase family protein [Clostridium estertheticum]|uniref:4'-phosphopantetheinyl transferase family protein n=1 Tax=Clostridium estertheticum TaxID=238834 RepID=UPI001C7CBE72|nr:4'-phosphopantetheinyl transferase superfamily protein [Clostridium estertheticum]MBX4266846.1 4'-phosphopantetheinyl transferase superfamily protein [Clostridium estertheticum]WLC89030.1 4'-phosphopantetheinyl transferase superfamily protein [Clostridium estertheticum]
MILQEIQKKILSHKKIAIGDYHAWIIDVRSFNNYIKDIKETLSDEEIKKSGEIKIKNNELLFCLRKGITRIILSSFLNMKPNEIKYSRNVYGRPFISNSYYKDFRFNISHSKEYLFVGIATKGDIGVDIEKTNLKLRYSLLAESVFSPKELVMYNNYNELNKLCSFYKAWVQKEAISKALGVGISIGFNSFSVNIDPDLNDEQYNLNFDNVKYPIKMNIKFEKNYFFATALLDN